MAPFPTPITHNEHPLGGSVLVAAAALLWGLWPIWIEGRPAMPAAGAAFLTTGVVGLPIALLAGRGRPRRAARVWILLAVLGAVDAANVWLYFRALGEGAVAPAVLSHYLAPVLVALTAPAFLGEPQSPRTPAALGLALGGTAILVGAPAGPATGLALAFGSASAVFFAASMILSKRLAPYFADAELLVYHLLVAAALLIGVGGLGPIEVLLRPALGGLASALLAGLFFYAGLRRTPAERVAVLAYLEPPAAVLAGWLALGQRPSLAAAAGGALILMAGLLVVVPGRRRYPA